MMSSQLVATKRAELLADRLEQGAGRLLDFAEELSDRDWNRRVPGDGRTIGVVIHHVASVYPVEIQLVQTLASGKPIEGVTKEGIDRMNADHAREFASVGKRAALDLLMKNSKAAADAIRELSDEQLDSAAEVSLYGNAPLTAQFVLEDHALRHSFHHLAKIQSTLKNGD